MKTCTQCKQEKELEFFHISQTNRDGRKSKCNRCATKQVSEARKKSRPVFYGDFYDKDTTDYQDSKEYREQCQLVERSITERLSVNSIVRKYPETRDRIYGILNLLEFAHKIRFTGGVLIPHVEPVPPRERELELARRKANQETINNNCGNSMLFHRSTAEREKYAELGLPE
jgi:hypothetical protein